MELYRQALRIQPDHPLTHFNLGVALASRQQFSEAASEFELAGRFDPRNPHVHVGWGAVLLSQGKTQEAAGRFAEALRLDPDNRMAREGLAEAAARSSPAPVAVTQ
jgi:cytochrome c-type biogenesis protein CcmH/NrfG